MRLSIPTIEESDIKFTNTVLGSGSFGSVILSIWKNTEVAVKKMKASEEMKYIYREINIMDKIRHPNLISIMGVCSTESYFYIVMEYFKSQNLAIFMSKRDEMLDYAVKKNQNYSIALQMCKAITFLHEFDPTILHKDIKPENILINNFFMIKICDFGLSKMCDGSTALEITVGQYFRGTPLYMPPEILIDHTQGTTYSD
ncbi:GSCOCG00011297001-RA-CDS, partial [Cotesia congregata]